MENRECNYKILQTVDFFIILTALAFPELQWCTQFLYKVKSYST